MIKVWAEKETLKSKIAIGIAAPPDIEKIPSRTILGHNF
jgi:hypothetical protein